MGNNGLEWYDGIILDFDGLYRLVVCFGRKDDRTSMCFPTSRYP